jgi:hypothetical protein
MSTCVSARRLTGRAGVSKICGVNTGGCGINNAGPGVTSPYILCFSFIVKVFITNTSNVNINGTE